MPALVTFDAADWYRQASDMGVMFVLSPEERLIVGMPITEAHEAGRRIEAVKAPLYGRPERMEAVKALLREKGLRPAPPD